jgi:phosphoenolpyruvate carboxylase
MNIQAQSILEDTSYIEGITETLRELLRQVIKQREPSVLTILDDPEMASGIPEHLVEHALQVIGIWLQLMNIAEENASMRNRREIERQGGPDEVIGSFSYALGQAAALGVEPETVGRVLEALDVGPTITAHPTEAKRVTVLEIHRRIYLMLYELESPRWTPRERQALLAALKNEIDLLWLTGEVRLEKPTVENEISWGLYFFRETLFDRAPALCEQLRAALYRHYPELKHDVRPPLSYASWIGGDRDGNPYVTVEVTRSALMQNRAAAVDRVCRRLRDLAQLILQGIA